MSLEQIPEIMGMGLVVGAATHLYLRRISNKMKIIEQQTTAFIDGFTTKYIVPHLSEPEDINQAGELAIYRAENGI